MDLKTHPSISAQWVGEPVELAPRRAVARLQTRQEMCADGRGLVHGGFAFGLADYAAMLAVNDPHVVLGAAEVKFLAPVRCGETLTARAQVEEKNGKKRLVTCSVTSDREVFVGTFTCFVLPGHVLDQ
ncbi:MAG: thioesterase [Desulfuromonas sp.]|uniref:PaaI family thioesterase n=1 Tax=Desulfuromonas sp. TaxID=892 RepID=UPI000CB13754|nr:hotdog domain-containing protein [Desulfuromonas sp.]PLX85130.1 MAG: thioesterase [Desulfuromonas sp.]